jgi:MscS family membrane protein
MKRGHVARLLLIVTTLLVVVAMSTGVASARAGHPNPGHAGMEESVLASSGEDGTAEPPTLATRLHDAVFGTNTPEPTAAGEAEGAEPSATPLLSNIVSTRVPGPTATPGKVAEEVTEFTASVGLAGKVYLGLTTDDWINLWISILALVFAYLLGTWLIKRVLPRAVSRTPTEFDDRLLKAVGPQVRWLVVLAILYFATNRLLFVSAQLKAILNDLYFVLTVFLGLRIVWKLIDLGGQWYGDRVAGAGREDELTPTITLLVRLARLVAVVAGAGILLSNFGVDIVAFTAALGIGGLAVSLAARDTVADMIAGFIILLDRPFRIGDRIEIQGAETWGDVVDIGLRTTRVRTRDNRMVIVPNSIIGTSQVINYTYPDPQYRIETQVEIAYGSDIRTVRGILVDAVRHVEGVLPDRSVDALYIDMGDPAMIFLVRWWIESYVDTRTMLDRVHTAIQEALNAAGIESGDIALILNHYLAQETENQLSSILGGRGQPTPASAG